MILNVFKGLIYAYYLSIRDHCLLFWKNLLYFFNFVQYIFTFLFTFWFHAYYFFYSWPQYFWQEINTRKLWLRLKCKPCLIFCHQETCHMSFCCILHFQCFVWKALQRVNSSTGLFTCNWVSRACQSTWARDRCIMQLMQKLMQITFLTIQVERLCYYPAIQVTSQFDSSSVWSFFETVYLWNILYKVE